MLSVRFMKNKKNKSFYSVFTYSSSDALLSLCRSKFLTYIIFLLSNILLLTFLAKQVYWQKKKVPSICVFLRKSLFLFHFSFFGCTHCMQRFLGQGSNWHHSRDPSNCSDNVKSLPADAQENPSPPLLKDNFTGYRIWHQCVFLSTF